VLLAAGVESKFDTLAEAVQRASDGDTIEIRGNGPFVTPPVIINRALAIRAAAGYRPVIRLAEGGQAYALLHSRAPLTLEGLEFQWPPRQQAWKPGQQKPHIVFANGNSLHVANCCFRTVKSDPNQPDQLLSIGAYAPTCSVRNCEFFSTVYFSHSISTSSRALVLDNCLHLRQSALVRVFGDTAGGAEYVLSRNTVVRGTAIWFGVQIEDGQLSQAVKPVDLVATGNLFDAIKVVHFFELERKSQPLEPDEAESLFPRLVAWNGRENVYPAGSNFLLWWSFNGEDRPGHGPKDLEGWKQYWNSPETGSAQGRFRYQGGDLVARFWDAPEKLTAGDFRLRPDSAGYRAGPDGKDLGADVDLVGPGAAYERWKKTPEYQTWLKDTGQLGVKPPPPEVGAFVLLAAGTERKFDTLAAAVLAANDGDTIEIRGNGPFVTRPVMIDGALAIRAGASYRPVIRLAEGGQADAFLQSSAPLTLEGLEFQWPRQQASKPGQLNPNIISANGNSLHVANCCFRMDKSDPNQPAVLHCIGAYSPTCSVRNCEFFSPLQGSFSIFTTSRAFVLDNCVHLAQCSMARNFRDTEGGAEYVLSRNTVVNRGKAIWFGVQIEDEQLSRAVKPVDLVATGNLFDAIDVVLFGELERKSQPLEPDEAESLLRRLVAWNGRENVYPAGSNFLIHWNFLGEGRPDHGPRDLEGWKQYWNSPETASAQGRFRYQGGDLVARFAEAPEKLTADDFRLREDSAGYRAGPDGKDLGADVDLVGPGPAYERWKKMPEYEDWLKETGQ
jgi:endonuclease YncB( thermonuclease family)